MFRSIDKGTEDANKIISNDAACPVCDQVLSKRQKRKLDEMYDKLRSEYESVKRSSVQPANFFSRAEPDLFSSMANMMDGRATVGQDQSVFTPETPGQREEIWPSTRQKNSSSSAFDLSGGSPAKTAPGPVDTGTRRQTGSLFGAGVRNPTATLRNLIISPMKRPQLSRNHPHIFTNSSFDFDEMVNYMYQKNTE
ncbi:hypothetical protein C4D60_Mb02t16250 [Musa balbisiana]|uniref:Uncharacterized protein n=1 Tax=Musa balbisiana TaxID=52838 RepID=A0A4S8IC03_MUSBA|nr:hypothetical protein C4D60_Mb02t16250 [Musa balbisiana]